MQAQREEMYTPVDEGSEKVAPAAAPTQNQTNNVCTAVEINGQPQLSGLSGNRAEVEAILAKNPGIFSGNGPATSADLARLDRLSDLVKIARAAKCADKMGFDNHLKGLVASLHKMMDPPQDQTCKGCAVEAELLAQGKPPGFAGDRDRDCQSLACQAAYESLHPRWWVLNEENDGFGPRCGGVSGNSSPAMVAEQLADVASRPRREDGKAPIDPLSLIHDLGDHVFVSTPEELIPSMENMDENTKRMNQQMLAFREHTQQTFYRTLEACNAQLKLDIAAANARAAAAKEAGKALDPYR
jgi:hypothetical protein